MPYPDLAPNDPITTSADRSEYDILALMERADQWRAEVEVTISPAMRAFCLDQALQHERRVERSKATPPIA
jgi:hypothetical protein